MSDQSELMRRAEELADDLNTVYLIEPEGVDHDLMEKALTHIITGSLLLKGTTAEFKASIDS